jgi:hypothetical protein
MATATAVEKVITSTTTTTSEYGARVVTPAGPQPNLTV